jgi:hypothetical protein
LGGDGDRLELAGLRQSGQRARSTHTCLWRFSGLLTGVPYESPFPEFVEKIRIR